jgi:hypothetical protein
MLRLLRALQQADIVSASAPMAGLKASDQASFHRRKRIGNVGDRTNKRLGLSNRKSNSQRRLV